MRNRPTLLLLAFVAIAALAFDSTGYKTSQTTFYMRASGTSCGADIGRYLATTPGSGEPGCGYQGGAPFGELYHAGLVADTVNHFSTTSAPNVRLDANRAITGKNRVVATATTNRNAAGQVRVDTTVFATFAGGGSGVIGTNSQTINWIPGQTPGEVDFPFTMDVPDQYDGKVISMLNIDVDIRGLHVLTGYHRLNGESFATVPTWVPIQP